jgi:AcrR family transcriptional regulator
MEKDREKTKMLILQTLGKMLAQRGFKSIGINAIAREAEVDKVLIYRYFGGLPGLLEAYAHEADYWPLTEDLTRGLDREVESTTQTDLAKHMIRSFCRYLRERPLTQELLRWEMVESNELTSLLADFRETEGLKLMKLFEQNKHVDINALATIVVAGIMYLVLCMKHINYFNGINLQAESGWERLENAAAWMIESSLKMSERNSSQ